MSGYIGTQPVPQATQTRDSFTATAGQTSFATGGYTPQFLDLFMNGIHLINGTDYTAANGSDVILTTGAAAGDLIEVIAYSTFEVADTVSASAGGTFAANVDITGVLTSDGLTSAGDVLLSQSASNSSITINRTDSASQYNLTMGQSGVNPYLTGNDAETFNINVDPDNTQSSSNFRVNIDGSEAMRVDSSGQLSVGTNTIAAANAAADDFVIKGPGTLAVGMTISNSSASGTGTIFFGDNGNSAAGGFRYNHNTDDLTISAQDKIHLSSGDGSGVVVTNGNLVIGTAGKGIDFSNQASPAAGMSSELLDRYEEGTGASGVTGSGGGTATTTGFASYYTRVGRIVQFQFEFRVTSISGCSGRLQLTLPFASLDYSAGALRCYDVTFDGSPFCQAASGSSVVSFEASKTGTVTQDILSTGYYFGSITYAV